MMRGLAVGAIGLAGAAFATPASAALEQQRDCEFLGAIQGDLDSGTQQTQKRNLASDALFRLDAVPCLVGALSALRGRVTSADIDPATLDQLIAVTGALRSVLQSRGQEAIEEFRAFDDPRAISVLAYTARSADASARINATLILADTVDDTTVCVPIDHLYDPEIRATEGGDSGRVNLLGVISVVAPWAYKENFDNIARLVREYRGIYTPFNAPQTWKLLDNIEERLKYQDTLRNPNKNETLPFHLRDCAAYEVKFANDEVKNLIY